MAVSHRDVLRSVMREFALSVAPTPVLYDGAVESTSGNDAATAGLPAWFDGDIISLEPLNDQRSDDYLMRGTLRIRGFWRQQPGAPAGVGIDDKFRLSSLAETALRSKNIAVMDWASGTGSTQVAVAEFSDTPFSTLDPVEGIGIILINAEFLLT